MTKRQENERMMQARIDQLERELDHAKYTAAPITTRQSVRVPTPAERYVNPRSRVNRFKFQLFINQLFILFSLLHH
jgi:hypothetical protein